tara:strand:+ start:2208 stop:3245 length:1038 start_codon:yes stop_codon:yes gene_type:complete
MPYIGNTAGNRFVASQAATRLSGNGSAVAFTLEHSVSSDEDILVSVDGVIQEPSIAYAVSNGTTLTFTAAPSNGTNNIFVCYLFRTVATVNHPSTSSLQATDGTFTGDLTVDTDTLFADASNDKVGINNASPNHELQINGNSTTSSLSLKTSATGNTTSDGLELKVQGDSAAYLYNYENAMLRFGTNGLERIRIDADGHVTMQSQSAFSVHKNGTHQENFANDGSAVTVTWSTERFDNNSDFSSNTFTAPVTGKYLLTLVMRINTIDTVPTYYIPTIVTSNQSYRDIIDPNYASDLNYKAFKVVVIADMDASDTAYVTMQQSGGTQASDINGDNPYTYFTGALLC